MEINLIVLAELKLTFCLIEFQTILYNVRKYLVYIYAL